MRATQCLQNIWWSFGLPVQRHCSSPSDAVSTTRRRDPPPSITAPSSPPTHASTRSSVDSMICTAPRSAIAFPYLIFEGIACALIKFGESSAMRVEDDGIYLIWNSLNSFTIYTPPRHSSGFGCPLVGERGGVSLEPN